MYNWSIGDAIFSWWSWVQYTYLVVLKCATRQPKRRGTTMSFTEIRAYVKLTWSTYLILYIPIPYSIPKLDGPYVSLHVQKHDFFAPTRDTESTLPKIPSPHLHESKDGKFLNKCYLWDGESPLLHVEGEEGEEEGEAARLQEHQHLHKHR